MEPTPEDLLLARRMCRAGKTLEEIHAALKWPVTIDTTLKNLRKHGIPLRRSKRKLAHAGDDTYVPPNHLKTKFERFDVLPKKAKEKEWGKDYYLQDELKRKRNAHDQ